MDGIGRDPGDHRTDELYIEQGASLVQRHQRIPASIYLKKPGVQRSNAETGIYDVACGAAHRHDERDGVADGQDAIGKDKDDVRRRTGRIEDICESATENKTAKQARRESGDQGS